jgi:hypothetical protein
LAGASENSDHRLIQIIRRHLHVELTPSFERGHQYIRPAKRDHPHLQVFFLKEALSAPTTQGNVLHRTVVPFMPAPRRDAYR